MKNLIIIPARLESTRLPNKALADINGEPMIVHVYKRAIESGIADVLVAAGNEEIKIEQARSLINFLSKSTYLKDLKIVLIDNAEFLNINTSNALLKAIEEPTNNTFFFIIYNDSGLIPDTIKSRSIEYKIFLSKKQKINIFSKLVNLHNYNLSLHEFEEEFYFDTPGNKLKYLFFLNDAEFIDKNDMLKCIFYFIVSSGNTLIEILD